MEGDCERSHFFFPVLHDPEAHSEANSHAHMERCTRQRVEAVDAVCAAASAARDPKLLASARVVFHERPRVGALPHVVEKLNAFLDCSCLWSLEKAARTGSMRLLVRVVRATDRDSTLSPEAKRVQYQRAARIATGRYWLAAVQVLYGRDASVLNTTQATVAALMGDLAMLEWIHACEPTILRAYDDWVQRLAFGVAAERGEMGMVRWLVETFPDTPRCLGLAAVSGNLVLVKWLHQHANCDRVSAERPRVDYRLERRIRMDRRHRANHLVSLNAQEGFVDKALVTDMISRLEYWCDLPRNKCAIDWAARGGYLEVVQWLHTNRQDGCTTDAMDGAAAGGHLAVVQWLHANRTEGCTTDAIDHAVMNGHIEVVEWLCMNRTEGYTSVVDGFRGTCDPMERAASKGQLKMVKWLDANRSEGCTTAAMDDAAKNGHLEMVQWLHENRREGCTTRAMDAAAKNGELKMVKWLQACRSEGCTTAAMDDAAKNGHVEMVKWLHENRYEGCTTAAMDWAAENGHLAVVKWLHENRSEGCTTAAVDQAAANGHLDILQFLYWNRREGGTYRAYEMASENHHESVVRWLQENHVVPLVRADE